MAGMMWKVLACLLVLAVAVSAQTATGTVTVRTDNNQFEIGQASDFIFIELSEDIQAPGGLNVAWTSDSDQNNNGLAVSASSVNIPQGARSASFRVIGTYNYTYTLTFTLPDATQTQFALSTATLQFEYSLRQMTLENFPTATYIGEPTEPIQLYVATAPDSDLSINVQVMNGSANGVQIIPSTVVIKAGTLSTSFVVRAPGVDVESAIEVQWIASGNDVNFYDLASLPTTLNINNRQRQFLGINGASFGVNTEVVVDNMGYNWLYAYIPQAANNSVTLTPQAADTTFSPSSLTFNSGDQLARLQIVSTSPEISKTVYWNLNDADDYYLRPAPTTITVPKRKILVEMPNPTLVLLSRSYMTISLLTPTPSSINVDIYAANVQFNAVSGAYGNSNSAGNRVTFSSGSSGQANYTSVTVAIEPTNLGADQITFRISGPDAAYFDIENVYTTDNIATAQQVIPITIVGGTFFSPSSWYVPNLYVGVTSPKIPVYINNPTATKNGVVLTPYAPNVIFSPSSMTFQNGSSQAYFTMTPTYSNDAASSMSSTVTFYVTGPDHAYFTAPANVPVTISRRFIQTAWSAHLTNTDGARLKTAWSAHLTNTDGARLKTANAANPSARVPFLHLGKTYKVWVSANYVGSKDTVTVTPTSAYYSFNPKQMVFSAKTTRVLLEVTPTAVMAGARIDYMIGGSEGGWYAPIGNEVFDILIRPLAIEAAVVANDNRVPRRKATLMDQPDFSAATHLASGNWHVYSFKLRSMVLPDGGLTITPKCPHATFSPSSIKLGGHDATKILDSYTQITVQHPYYPFNSISYTATQPPASRASSQYIFQNNTGLYLEANFTVHAQAAGQHYVTFQVEGKDAAYYDIPADQLMTFLLVNRDGNEPAQGAAVAVIPSIVAIVVAIVAVFM